MIHRLYTVFDMKAKFYMPPFNSRNDAEAIRMFSDTANDLDTGIGRHPEDYILYSIGRYDDQTGKIEPEGHIALAKAVELVKQTLPLFDKEEAS